MIWDYYFCCHGNLVVRFDGIPGVFGTWSEWVHFLSVFGWWNASLSFWRGVCHESSHFFCAESDVLFLLLFSILTSQLGLSSPDWPWTCYLAEDELDLLVLLSLFPQAWISVHRQAWYKRYYLLVYHDIFHSRTRTNMIMYSLTVILKLKLYL